MARHTHAALSADLTVTDDNILLRGKNVVIPAQLINQVVALVHEGHQGIVKTKELLRSKVWFPQMNDIAESAVRRCFACQCTQNSKPHAEPMQMSDIVRWVSANTVISVLDKHLAIFRYPDQIMGPRSTVMRLPHSLSTAGSATE